MIQSARNKKTWRAVVCFAWLACLILAPGLQSTAFGQEDLVIAAGAVTNAFTGLPIAGVYISATYLYPDVEGEALAGEAWSAANGSYTVVDSGGYGASQYRFHISAAGYVPQWLERAWDGITPLNLNFALAPVQTVAAGTVTDATTGLPIAGASVSAAFNAYEFEWVIVDSTSTAANGAFTLCDPFGYGAHELTFSVYAAGYVDQSSTLYWDGIAPLEINFSLQARPVIAAGTITDANTGLPLANAYVWGVWTDGVKEYWTGRAYTGSDGTYLLYDHSSWGAHAYQFYAGMTGYDLQSSAAAWDGSNPLSLNFALVPDLPDPPVASPDAYSTVKNTTLYVPAPGVLSNDTDPDSTNITAVKVTNPSVGTLTLNANGSFTYAPKRNWAGTTSFTYRAYDGSLYSNTITVTITVSASSGGGGGRPK